MPKSYILPTFEAWALPLRNALLERLPVSFAFGKDLPAKLEVLPCAAAFAPAAELTLTIDGHPWRAYIENRALLPLHPLFDEAAMKDVAPESLPEPLLGLVAEALCGALTKSFSAAAGGFPFRTGARRGFGPLPFSRFLRKSRPFVRSLSPRLVRFAPHRALKGRDVVA